jgi:hypothetical protein
VWQQFKDKTKALGTDICSVVLNLCRSWLESQKEMEKSHGLYSAQQIIFLQQKNYFNYNVQRPRRERKSNCSKSYRKCTLCSKAFCAYILIAAKELDREFCFRDFTELEHGYFRKLIHQLREDGSVLAMKPRSLPEFYILAEWKDRYPTMSENNRVKPELTDDSFV